MLRLLFSVFLVLCALGIATTQGGEPSSDQADFVAGKLIVFNDNGGWCWYQDERVVVDPENQTMLIGSVSNRPASGGAKREADVEVTAHTLATGASSPFSLHKQLEADDHDTPAFLIRPDGHYLAVYSRHNHDKLTRWRVSTHPHDASGWDEEQTFDWSKPPMSIGDNNVTYSNLFYLPAEKRTYNFLRAVNRDPSILFSDDQGRTWQYGGKLLTDTNVGYVDGYVKYASNGRDRVDFITTEHHPRDYNNSIYHGYVQGGKTHRADGTVVDENIFDAPAPKAADLTPVLAADTMIDGEKMTHCWNADLAIDRDGNPYCLLTCRANDDPENTNFNDHRFFYARFDGHKWNVHQLAKAGARLWTSEQDYVGGGCVDPQNPNIVYISAPIDPRDQSRLAKHEVFRGVTSDGGTAWNWTPITRNSSVDNLRPVVPQWNSDRTALLWLRGTMRRSQDYDLRIVGTIEPNR
jgi:hypothetical protein